MVQGGTQALSRSLFASMVPPHKSGEFFGFFSVFEKFAGIFGPLFFAASLWLTGSSRNAILSVIVFFVAGAAILAFVDVEEGERTARAAAEDEHRRVGHVVDDDQVVERLELDPLLARLQPGELEQVVNRVTAEAIGEATVLVVRRRPLLALAERDGEVDAAGCSSHARHPLTGTRSREAGAYRWPSRDPC